MADVAMDLHKRHSQVATLDQCGEVRELTIEHDGDSRGIEKFLGGLEAGSRIAIEATASWWWVVDLAEKHGHEVVLSNPKKTRLIADGSKSRNSASGGLRSCRCQPHRLVGLRWRCGAHRGWRRRN
jgi:transposase